MRCKACNQALNEFEATRKSKDTGEFIDLCNNCYSFVRDDVQAIENFDLMDLQDSVDIDEEL